MTMATAEAIVPAESDLLCEACGYTLNGLPSGARCPECGIPAADSSPARRGPPQWERPGFAVTRFCATSAAVLFHPRRFYRGMATRSGRGRSSAFSTIHLLLASLLAGIAAFVHVRVYYLFAGVTILTLNRVYHLGSFPSLDLILDSPFFGVPVFAVCCFLALCVTTPLAARLTTWEARLRGYRLPLHVVRRGLDYHAAHYLPVAAMVAITVVGYRWFAVRCRLPWSADMNYLYFLCGEVIVGAVYLFWTYWIGMRNMMYANA
jgi:hypothetical protein